MRKRAGLSCVAVLLLLNWCCVRREWLGGMTTAYIAQTLLEDAERDPSSPARRILEEAEVHIVVPVNVDGFAFSWASDRVRVLRLLLCTHSPHTAALEEDPHGELLWSHVALLC